MKPTESAPVLSCIHDGDRRPLDAQPYDRMPAVARIRLRATTLPLHPKLLHHLEGAITSSGGIRP